MNPKAHYKERSTACGRTGTRRFKCPHFVACLLLAPSRFVSLSPIGLELLRPISTQIAKLEIHCVPNVTERPSLEDSAEKFKHDIDLVANELRASDDDPKIPALYRNRRPTFTKFWGTDDWELHTSRFRYLRYVLQFPTSRLLQRTLPQMIVLFVWSCVAVVISSRSVLVSRLHLGLTSISLVSTFIAALLTLRSNQSLSRLQEARNAFGKVILDTREMGQLIGTGIYPKEEQMALLAARHVALFSWSLKAHVRCTKNDDIVSTLLPCPGDASFVSNYKRKPPAAILMRLRQIFSLLGEQKKLDKEIQKALIQTTYRLNEALMIIERIRNSPIPPIYTAHTTRLLLFYLVCLPIALYDTLQNAFATVVVTLAAGYAMLGLDEISHILELPFKLMPLRQLSKISMIDSADAILHQPPPLQ